MDQLNKERALLSLTHAMVCLDQVQERVEWEVGFALVSSTGG